MAMPAVPQPGRLPQSAPPGRGTAGWLVGLLLAAVVTTSPAWAQTGVQYVQTVPDGAVYRWEYYYVPALTLPVGGSITITGLYHVQSAAATPAGWTSTFTASSVTYTWNGAAALPPAAGPPASGYFSYASASPNVAPVPWTATNTESGTVSGAAPTEAGVAAYDNWLSFGALRPTTGSAAAPVGVIADGSPASGWTPTASIPAVGDYDVGYLQIATPLRLTLSVSLGGHLTRCTNAGGAFAGVDTRKTVAGPYELATQWKVAFYGRFLDLAENGYVSPTSGQETAFDTWTAWSPAGNDPTSDDGWLWPSATDAWTGGAVSGYATVTGLDLLVERNQYFGSLTGAPAEFCLIERVLQRGQQDVAGNYRQVVDITLTYAE